MDIEQTNSNPESVPSDNTTLYPTTPPATQDQAPPAPIVESTPPADGSAGSPEPATPPAADQSAIENATQEAENGAQTPQDGPQDPEPAQNVPLARLQGVQRRLATTEAALQ